MSAACLFPCASVHRSRRRFRRQHRHHGVVGKFRHLDRQEIHSHLPNFRPTRPRCIFCRIPLSPALLRGASSALAAFFCLRDSGRLFLEASCCSSVSVRNADLNTRRAAFRHPDSVPCNTRLYRAILAISPLNRVPGLARNLPRSGRGAPTCPYSRESAIAPVLAQAERRPQSRAPATRRW